MYILHIDTRRVKGDFAKGAIGARGSTGRMNPRLEGLAAAKPTCAGCVWRSHVTARGGHYDACYDQAPHPPSAQEDFVAQPVAAVSTASAGLGEGLAERSRD
jgi:hypothetical protein